MLFRSLELSFLVAERLKAEGYRVEAPTIRSAVRTVDGPRAGLAGLTLADYVAEMSALAQTLAKETGKKPLVFGHSMGGLITVAYLLERPLKPDYVILSGPAIVPLLDPTDRRIDPTRLSKDPEVQRAYMEDPLVLRERVTDELYMRLADGLSFLPGRAAELTLPHPVTGESLTLTSPWPKDLTVA